MFDRVVCLTLEKRGDRRKRFIESVRGSKLLPKFEMGVGFEVGVPWQEQLIPPSWTHYPGYWAAGESHKQVWSEAYCAGCRNVLVFEDDAQLKPDFDEVVGRVMPKLPEGWHALYLGGTDHTPGKNQKVVGAPGLELMLGYVCQIHAYVLSREGMRRMFDHVWCEQHRVIDHAMAGLMQREKKMYCPDHWVVGLQGGWSDNEQKETAAT